MELAAVFIKIIGYLTKYLSDKQLIDAGEEAAISKSLQSAMARTQHAKDITKNVNSNGADLSWLQPSKRSADDGKGGSE